MQELDDRKTKILEAIIRNYMKTGEPVGSRTISKYSGLNVSSATIRNEMSDLEELGYIMQQHTSSGRIPTDKGYRFYVDRLMLEKDQELTELKALMDEKDQKMIELQELMIEKADRTEQVLKQVAKVLAVNTNYTSMITSPQYRRNKLKFIQLSQVDCHHIVAVVVAEGNVVKNKVIEVEEELDNETLLKLNILLNTHLNGLALEEINLGMIACLKEKAGIHSALIGNVLDAVAEAIQVEDDLEIYTSGATNIFKYPELSDNERASELISTLEEKQQLATLVSENSENNGIKVYIGSESPVQNMKDCSVVTATYELGEGMQGTIGIIGPKRMDYEKVVDTLQTLMIQLDHIFKKT